MRLPDGWRIIDRDWSPLWYLRHHRDRTTSAFVDSGLMICAMLLSTPTAWMSVLLIPLDAHSPPIDRQSPPDGSALGGRGRPPDDRR